MGWWSPAKPIGGVSPVGWLPAAFESALSVRAQTLTMNTDQTTDRQTPEDARLDVTVFVATFPTSQQAQTAEHAIGRLAAEGLIEVFDGELHEWPAEAPTPRRRALENLPRLAALPASVWASGAGLPRVGCATGWSSIMIFGSTDRPERVSAELIGAEARPPPR